MTREEFESYYARHYELPEGISTRDWLREALLLEAVECDCGCEQGWRVEPISSRPIIKLKRREE